MPHPFLISHYMIQTTIEFWTAAFYPSLALARRL